jgi:hypothetical protein
LKKLITTAPVLT